jgi:CRISPR-associated protein Csd2
MNAIITDVNKRHDFVLLFDVTDGNPNGDPDNGNLPRVDPETMQGLVTDVCLKRKVRNFVAATESGRENMRIYVQSKGIALNVMHKQAYDANGIKSTGTKQKREDVASVRSWMCEQFYDIRMFGAVMTTEKNCGQVRGPVQITFARSIDPVTPLDLSITRVAVTKPQDLVESEKEGGKVTEMGRKTLLPYGLYKAYGFFTPSFAEDTKAQRSDLEIFWSALLNMWDMDHSASKGLMSCRGIYIFSHDSKYGKAPAQSLLERVQVVRKDGVESPRLFSDYSIVVRDASIPEGVTLTRLTG